MSANTLQLIRYLQIPNDNAFTYEFRVPLVVTWEEDLKKIAELHGLTVLEFVTENYILDVDGHTCRVLTTTKQECSIVAISDYVESVVKSFKRYGISILHKRLWMTKNQGAPFTHGDGAYTRGAGVDSCSCFALVERQDTDPPYDIDVLVPTVAVELNRGYDYQSRISMIHYKTEQPNIWVAEFSCIPPPLSKCTELTNQFKTNLTEKVKVISPFKHRFELSLWR